jgi:radical SAM protein with 4Fe4S-binding SPASM domain
MKPSIKDYKTSKTFCSAPWMHLHVVNDGRTYPCCMTPIDNQSALGNVNENSLSEIMNSPKAKLMRKGMLEGKPLPQSCHRCVSKEESGLGSMRIGMNDHWFDDVEDLIATTNEDGSLDEMRLLYWDFRFSNYCNLACRTCSPLFSTAWDQDYIKVFGEGHGHLGLINLDSNKQFWDNLKDTIHTAKEIHFAGGEPLIMPEHWRLIEMLEKSNNYDVKLKYSTNVTMLTNKGRNIIDIWKKFKHVHLSLSIDGTGDIFELVRHKGKWEPTKKNLLAIEEAGIDFWVHPTISMLNIFRLDKIHKDFWEMGLIPITKKAHEKYSYNPDHYFISRFHINPVFFPLYYAIETMPKELKELATDKLTKYGKKMESLHGIPFAGWESLIDIMNKKEGDPEQFGKFINITKSLDRHRNQDFLKLNPEFKPYFD